MGGWWLDGLVDRWVGGSWMGGWIVGWELYGWVDRWVGGSWGG